MMMTIYWVKRQELHDGNVSSHYLGFNYMLQGNMWNHRHLFFLRSNQRNVANCSSESEEGAEEKWYNLTLWTNVWNMNQNKTLHGAQLSSSTYWMFIRTVFCSPCASLVSFHEYFFFLHQHPPPPHCEPRPDSLSAFMSFLSYVLLGSSWSLGRQLQAPPSQSSVHKRRPAVFILGAGLLSWNRVVAVTRHRREVVWDGRNRYETLWSPAGFGDFQCRSWVFLLLSSHQSRRQDVGWSVDVMM